MPVANPTVLRSRLAGIQTFSQLVAFLRDDIGWPIEREDFEDLTFEYTPEELGIDAKNAAKIQEIRRLRPISPHQPWGIFFVKFEPKRLPVVALRRILGSVALKKRASANAADRTAWRLDDLLFLSSYGEGDERQISFAHFAAPKEGDDLPALKVLGWDNLDTLPHLDAVARALGQHLTWPADDADREAWRAKWRAAFTLGHREVITTSKDLSLRLAELARAIHDRIVTALKVENDKGPLTKLMNAFRDALVHDLKPESFADMYAQTITYGLLSARITDPRRKTADDFAAHLRTSPFLRELMEHFLRVGGRRGKAGGPGIDFDELGVSDVVELLDAANMEAVVQDFGDKNRKEDPVIHFYEHFLAAYNKKLKVQRGVFYTPQPVVSYIVRSVHELLQTEFGLADGLADTTTWGQMIERNPGLKLPPLTDEPGQSRTISPDEPFVQILDPATGTATFLVEVIDVVYRTLLAKWQQQGLAEAQQLEEWNDYVPGHLLPRLHAYELMMAPYAIAHMKVSLKLAETGYRFASRERARIYLTNALEPWQKQLQLPDFDALAHEALAVNEIKRDKRFTIVTGNPPYSNFGRLNRNGFILGLLDDYKRGLRERKLNLDDDYIKFIRLAHHLIDAAGVGVVGKITNNVFLDGITHRQMRNALQTSFNMVSVCDLHGSVKKLEVAPDGSKDENVFDIQQGVGMTFLLAWPHTESAVHFRELWGSRAEKYSALAAGAVTRPGALRIDCKPPHYFFVPKALEEQQLWDQWGRIPELMPVHATGVKTHLDDVLVGFSRGDIEGAVAEFLRLTWESVPKSATKRASPLRKAVLLKESLGSISASVRPYAYRAFDTRKVAYLPSAIEAGDHRFPVMRHLLGTNIALVTTRQLSQGQFSHALVVRAVTDMCLLSTATKECGYVFPLLLSARESLLESGGCQANLSKAAEGLLERVSGDADDFLNYAYAVLHSASYRVRFAEFLKIDFPRVPLTCGAALFSSLAGVGGELAALHLLESPELDHHITDGVDPVSWTPHPEGERSPRWARDGGRTRRSTGLG